MRYVKLIIAIIIVCVTFSSCSILGGGQDKYFGFKKSEFTVIEEEDTHGGFLGDGWYYLILDCSNNREQAMELVKDWTPLPLSENLQKLMYDWKISTYEETFTLAEKGRWPTTNNCVYKFVDRNEEAVNKSDDTDLFNRKSFNFSIALYDLDTNTLYFVAYDT